MGAETTRMYKLTHDKLLEVLEYDPERGVFVWKVARSNRVKIGSQAGVFHQQSGGRYISIDNEKFMAHRLAFFYVNENAISATRRLVSITITRR